MHINNRVVKIEKRQSLWKQRKYNEIRVDKDIIILRPAEETLDDMLLKITRRKQKWE